MDSQIVAVFCLCDDMLKALHHREDQQCQMTDSEVMTTAIVAPFTFEGIRIGSYFLQDEGIIPQMLAKVASTVACIAFKSYFSRCSICSVKPGRTQYHRCTCSIVPDCRLRQLSHLSLASLSRRSLAGQTSQQKTLFLRFENPYYGHGVWSARRILPHSW